MEPPSGYGAFVRSILRQVDALDPRTRLALAVEHPLQVFLTAQADGHLLALNYNDTPASASLDGQFETRIPPYGITRIRVGGTPTR
jgi:hypothetical protein